MDPQDRRTGLAALDLFESVMQWLRVHYGDFSFATERDVVWTVQRQLVQRIAAESCPYRIFNDYPMLPGPTRALCTDIAVLSEPVTLPTLSPQGKWGQSMPAALAVEFKYEPAHGRWGKDIWPTKGWVVSWADIGKDIARIQEYVAQGRAQVAVALVIDEARAFRHRSALLPGRWLDWTNGVSVHWTQVDAPLA